VLILPYLFCRLIEGACCPSEAFNSDDGTNDDAIKNIRPEADAMIFEFKM
jgi:hypothetical protein